MVQGDQLAVDPDLVDGEVDLRELPDHPGAIDGLPGGQGPLRDHWDQDLLLDPAVGDLSWIRGSATVHLVRWFTEGIHQGIGDLVEDGPEGLVDESAGELEVQF